MQQKTIEAIRDFLKELSTGDMVSIVSDLNSYNGNLESLVWYNMSEIDDFTSGMSHWEVLRIAHYGDFNPMDDYFHFNGCGNLESADFPELDAMDIDEIIEEIDNIPYKYLPDDIQFIIDENETEEEEEN